MTALYKHIIARSGMSARSMRNWTKNGLPYYWKRSIALQGQLMVHEGAWVLEWDGEEFPITDEFAGSIKTEQQLRASNALKLKG